MWILVDCNNFYVSCERVFRPDLIGKPVVVLSNNDGCVISRSNEAKKLGIPMGAPAFQYEELMRKHKVTVFSANFALYGDMSQRVMNILKDYSDEIEIYSIDEAFLKIEDTKNSDIQAFCERMKYQVQKWTGIPISIGVAPTKALSKVAMEVAKKFADKTGNIHIIDTEEKRLKALKWLPIEDVWGIGRQYTKKLRSMGITNAYQFTQINDTWTKRRMTIVGLRLKKDLLGIPTLDFETLQARKSIATTRTFETNYTEFNQLRERVATFAVSCAEKLRKQHSCCNSIMVFLITNPHRKDLPQYYRNILLELPFPTNSSIELAKFAIEGLRKIYKEGYHYKKAGVIVMNFVSENNIQLNLFENSNPEHSSLMKAMDKINSTFGQHTVKLASQDPKRRWKMKQERLSPRYTTKIDEIITIKA